MLELIQAWDAAAILNVQTWWRFPILDPIVCWFTSLGNMGIVFIATGILLALYPKTRRIGIMALAALAVGFFFTNGVLKHLVGRVRPWLVVEGLTALVVEGDPNSFPSGHASAAFAMGVSIFIAFPRRWVKVVALVMAVLMGLSRIYVGVHYPSDVLVGALVGTASAVAVWWAVHQWERRQLRD